MVDFFDLNSWGSDSHLQFLNWTVDNNGAYDYAANTRGYTDGALIEYDDHWLTVRFAETLMPKVANGIHLDADIARARAENVELEARGKRSPSATASSACWPTSITAIWVVTRKRFEITAKARPPLPTSSPPAGRDATNTASGSISNRSLRRISAFSDALAGATAATSHLPIRKLIGPCNWGRSLGGAPGAGRTTGRVLFSLPTELRAAHQQYLALGGIGFLLGDGGLTYGPEKMFEGFYTAHVWRGVFASFDLQHINNPGYNKTRGPVIVPALRLHIDF